MGKIAQGIDGQIVNRVGNHVYRVRKGVNVVSIYQPNVANPDTLAQRMQRLAFSILVQFVARLAAVAKVGFQFAEGAGTGYNKMIKYNSKDGVTGTYPNYALNFSALQMSRGILDLPYSPSASLDSNNLTIGWTDNSDMCNGSPDDSLALVIYNSTKEQVVHNLIAAKRRDTSYTFNCPPTWNGDDIEVYIFFRGEKLDSCSKSAYMGHFSL